MSEKGKKTPSLRQCPKCQGEKWKQEELCMYGRHGVMGKGWRFWVFICQECGYSELYHKDTSVWT
jgi:predicted nucleic-acid-binding Zn-ribbon protein